MTHALPAQPAALANLLADLSRQFLESVKSYSVDQATTEPPVGSQAELLGQLCKAHEQQERSVHTAAEGELIDLQCLRAIPILDHSRLASMHAHDGAQRDDQAVHHLLECTIPPVQAQTGGQ